MSNIVDINAYIRELALDLFILVPYDMKVADYLDKEFGHKSILFRQKVLLQYEEIFLNNEDIP